MITQDIINQLINCEKRFDGSVKKLRQDGAYFRQDYIFISQDGKHEFSIFLRQNSAFQENFSIGMVYKYEDIEVHLIRCNGPHGPNRCFTHHSQPHIHIADAEAINNGQKAEQIIEETSEYSSFDSALSYFLKRINLTEKDRLKFRKEPQQGDLFAD